MIKHTVFTLLVVFLLSSCGGRIIYFQKKKESKNDYDHITITSQPDIRSHKIEEGDVLQIKLNGSDEKLVSLFNKSINDPNHTYSGHQVQSNGTIYLPFTGNIAVKGMILDSAEIVIKDSLSRYIHTTNLSLDLVAFQVIVLGEVGTPGRILVPTDNASIVDVLALVGDLTSYGNPDNIKLIRQVGDKKEITFLDLTDIDIFNHSNYYMKSNDILYVETLRRQFVRENLSYIAILATVLNTIAIVSLRF